MSLEEKLRELHETLECKWSKSATYDCPLIEALRLAAALGMEHAASIAVTTEVWTSAYNQGEVSNALHRVRDAIRSAAEELKR